MWRSGSKRLVPLLRALPPSSASQQASHRTHWLASFGSQTHPRFNRYFSGEASKPAVEDEAAEVDEDLGIATGPELQELLAEKQGKKLWDLDPPRSPFGTKGYAAWSSGQAHYCQFICTRSYANAPTIDAKELDCSPELKDLHEKFTTEVKGKRTVPLALLRNIFEKSNSTEDVDLAFQILQTYRVYRSSKARVKQSFNQNISTLAVTASLRSRSYGLGFVEKVFEAQKLREEAGLDHTMASAFATAKAHILQGKPQIGAELIAEHCKDGVRVKKYLTMLVRAWPSELLSRKEQTQIEGDDPFAGLKGNVTVFANALSKKFRGVWIDAEEEYGKDLRKLKNTTTNEESAQ